MWKNKQISLRTSVAGIKQLRLGLLLFGLLATPFLTQARSFTGTKAVLANVYPPISYGEAISASIASTGEVDTYTFSGTTGDIVLIRMTESFSSAFTPFLELLGPGGNSLGTGANATLVELRLTLSSSGTYTILTRDNTTGTGNYGLFLQRVSNPGNATPISYGETISASITFTGEVDTYTFSGNTGDVVLIRMTESPSSGFSPFLELFGPDGSSIEMANDPTQVELRLTLSSSGTYTILTRDNTTGTGSYGLFLLGIPSISITVAPSLLDFGNVSVGEPATESVTVSNTGSNSFNVTSIALTGTDADRFSVATTPFTLSGGGNRDLEVTFTPNAARSFTASLDIKSDEGDLSVTLGGTGISGTAPAAPTSLGASAGDGRVDLTWQANTEPDVRHYRLYRDTASPASTLLDSVVVGTVFYTDTGVTNDITYFYRLTAVNTADLESDFSNEVNVTSMAGDDTTAPAAPSGLTADPGDGQVSLSWIANTEPDLNQYWLYRDTSSNPGTRISTIAAGTTTHTDTDLANGTRYYYRLKAVDASLNESGFSNEVEVFVRPSRITVQTSLSFTDTTQTSYRMIGVPGETNLAVAATFTGQPPVAWRVFWDNGIDGAQTDYLAEYDGSGTFTFVPGRGFWSLSRTLWTVAAQEVDTVPLDADDSFAITLHAGWNVLSNPFNVSVAWNAVNTLNRVRNGDQDIQPFWAFQGSHSSSDTFEPYQGYYFLNTGNLPDLKIPYAPPGSAAQNAREPGDGIERMLKLSVYQGAVSTVEVGIRSGAEPGLDGYDYVAPPSDFEAVKLALVREELSPRYQWLAREVRPELGGGQAFELTLKAVPGETVRLQVEGVEQFAGYEVYLVDRSFSTFHDLRAHPVLQLLPLKEQSAYRLLIGSAGFIEKEEAESVPEVFRLSQNYPNPFNPSTVIEYALPLSVSGEAVRLEVYNVLGQRVKVLVASDQEGGFYRVVWDGTDEAGVQVASGVYVYRLQVGDFSQGRRMLLLK